VRTSRHLQVVRLSGALESFAMILFSQ